MTRQKSIPKDLQLLVYWAVGILGQAIKKEYGSKTYTKIEALRKTMKGLRKSTPEELYKGLLVEKKKIEKLATSELEEIALSFSFMLELINRCENAYRSHKLSLKEPTSIEEKPYAIIMVLTAHPTEARSPQVLELFLAIQGLLIKVLKEGQKKYESERHHLLLVSLKLSIARRSKPSVLDEAQNIYSYILQPEILKSLIDFSEKGINVSFRAWVGGDKDGHPGVNEKTMLQSLNISRRMISAYISKKLNTVDNIARLIERDEFKTVKTQLVLCKEKIKSLQSIKKGDGELVRSFDQSFQLLCKEYLKHMQVVSPRLEEIKRLLWIFPAMVVPLEVREDSEVVAEALQSSTPLAIEKMLILLKEISSGHDAKWYVRGFILSMVESHKDIINGHRLVSKVFKNYKIPIVPLFENEKALTQAKSILTELFKEKANIPKHHLKLWGGRYEVMVGYSDSSKENGVFPSRFLISNALKVIEKTLRSYKLTPVFFHGSGGSIERGGGSIKEQTRWWPKSALNIFKATIQGEMVARNFGDEKIFSSQITKIAAQLGQAKKESHTEKPDLLLERFSNLIQEKYSKTIADPDFKNVIDSATPYSFLSHLKIGSRPSKRATGGDSLKLRAIPWILCWTQTRVLFPTWWGIGSAWEDLSKDEKNIFKNEYQNNPLVSSFLNALGFTLAKVELGVWKIYLSQSKLAPSKQEEVYSSFETEYNKSIKFFKAVTKKNELLWFRPWLQESINFRSPMIHPLNLIQLEALKRGEINLLSDTVTGISCGMLTTG
jgi:phosphoenolpyruvate carboxylase